MTAAARRATLLAAVTVAVAGCAAPPADRGAEPEALTAPSGLEEVSIRALGME